MYQILTGKEFKEAVKDIPLNAECKYISVDKDYCVWELSDEDFNLLDSYYDEYDYFEEGQNPNIWKKEWGWWRWCNGSNINTDPICNFIVNGNSIKLHYSENCLIDFIKENIEDFKNENGVLTKEVKNKLTEEAKVEFFSKEYENFLSYCSDQYGASTEKNVCAISVESAKLNNMDLAEFWKITVK